MTNAIQPFQLIMIALAGWLNRHQQVVIDYLVEEIRVRKEKLEGHRLRFSDEQRIRLAVKGPWALAFVFSPRYRVGDAFVSLASREISRGLAA